MEKSTGIYLRFKYIRANTDALHIKNIPKGLNLLFLELLLTPEGIFLRERLARATSATPKSITPMIMKMSFMVLLITPVAPASFKLVERVAKAA